MFYSDPLHNLKAYLYIMRIHPILLILTILVPLSSFVSCKNRKEKDNNATTVVADNLPVSSPFNADSAYSFVLRQVEFGPRVPGSKAHEECGDWLANKLSAFGASVIEQKAPLTTHDGKQFEMRNIIASFNPDEAERLLLFAHWDTRPWCDQDEDPAWHDKPLDGADDGASGVAVLLEMARLIQGEKSKLGVDIVLFDLEDYGKYNAEDSWCLGSTYWSQHPHKEGYTARYGILLDMVGAKDARFKWEYFSKSNASHILSKVWKKASENGYTDYFIPASTAALTDDHIPVMRYRGIPSINIVNYCEDRTKGFGDHWHTHADNINVIDKNVLKAVGSTIWSTINE